MKISVVTVTYNCQNVIEETIRSVIEQTYSDLEYIVVDGASKDNTLNIIKKYSSHIHKIISEPDKGIFDAMNKSLGYITGDYVIFINAGDRLINSHIIADIFEGKEYTEDLIYGDIYIENECGFLFCQSDAIYSKNPTKYDYVFQSQGFSHQALFTKTSVLRQVKFDLAYPLGADYDTTYKVFKSGNHQLHYTEKAISIFDDRFGGASHNNSKRIYEERSRMFNYKKGIYYHACLWKILLTENLKSILTKIFPSLAYKRRVKKYLKKIQ